MDKPFLSSPQAKQSFGHSLLAWHEHHAKSYPWRTRPPGERDPYHVWIAEIMAQQTRLAAVVPYFERWMQRFPGIPDVAAAPEQEITRIWAGLGYYRRALNIHRTARILMEQHGGQVPSSRLELLALPGIGRYTAGAILSLSFNQPEPAIDGNVVRAFSRLCDAPFQASRKRDLDVIDGQIRDILVHARPAAPGTIAEALMGLGSSICLPRIPRCHACPVSAHCRTYARAERPTPLIRTPGKALPVRHYLGFLLVARLEDEPHLLLVQHKPLGILGGLWAFPALLIPGAEADAARDLQARVQTALGLDIGPAREFGSFTQGYSHFRRIQRVFWAECPGDQPQYDLWAAARWVRPNQLPEYPLSVLDQRIARALPAL